MRDLLDNACRFRLFVRPGRRIFLPPTEMTTLETACPSLPDATVFLVDDDPSVRRGLSRLLRFANYNVETYECSTDFLRRVRPRHDSPSLPPSCRSSCLVLDIRMPDVSGMELQEALGKGDYCIPIIFITGHGDIPTSVNAMKKGAIDFLPKPVDRDALLAAVRTAMEKDAACRQSYTRRSRIQRLIARLTPREREVMTLVVAGRLNKQIAADLDISVKTVKVHRGRVMEKMAAQSVAELVRLAEAQLGGDSSPSPRPGTPRLLPPADGPTSVSRSFPA